MVLIFLKMNILQQLNQTHQKYKSQLPKENWTDEFKENLKIDFTYYSNQLEGNKINYGDTVNFLKTGLLNTNTPPSIRDIKDLENHQALLTEIFKTYNSVIINEKTIKSLHGQLMKDPVQWADNDGKPVNDALNIVGDYRQDEAFGTREFGVLKEYISHFHINKNIQSLLKWYNTTLINFDINTPNNHPINVLAQFHQTFVNDIHPFKNGNGRMVRLLTNIELMKLNYPPLLIKNKEQYISAIIESEKTNNPSPMVNVFAEDLIASMENQLAQL